MPWLEPKKKIINKEADAEASAELDRMAKEDMAAEKQSADNRLARSMNARSAMEAAISRFPVQANCKLTAELTGEMVRMVKKGNYPATVAVACGINQKTFYDWLKRGAAGEEPFASFTAQVAQACAESEIEMVDSIRIGDERGAGFGPAKASLELIGRRYPKRWGPQIKIEVADQMQKFLDTARRICPAEVYLELIEALSSVEQLEEAEDY